MTKENAEVYARIADLALYGLEAQADKLGIDVNTADNVMLCEILTMRELGEVEICNYDAWTHFFKCIIALDKKQQERIKENA